VGPAVTRVANAVEEAIRDVGVFLDRWPEAVRGLITGRHAPEVYAELLTGPAQGIKNVISFTAAV